MKTLGIELADQGVILALNNDGDLSFLGLESDTVASPGVVYFNGKRFMAGKDAQKLTRLHPRSVCDSFWDQLSLRESDLITDDRAICYSELAYQHCKHIWSRIQASGQKIDKVVIAVPGHYLENPEQEEEKIGLILGIASDLDIPLTGITDIANASLFSEASTFAGMVDSIIHLDVYQHAVLFMELLSNGQLETKNIHRIPNLGYNEFLLELFPKLSNRFLSQTAFDVSHNTETEQQFLDKMLNLLIRLSEARETTLELEGLRRNRKMSVSRNLIARLMDDFNSRIINAIRSTVPQNTLEAGNTLAVLSERILRIPGLRNKLTSNFNFKVFSLEEGSAAVGAANLAVFQDKPIDIADTPIITPINYSAYDIKPDPNSILRQTIGAKSDARSVLPANAMLPSDGHPTHIVYRGLAYPMGESEFILSPFKSENQTGIKLPLQQSGETILQCRLIRKKEGWLMEKPSAETPVSVSPECTDENPFLQCASTIKLGKGSDALSFQLIALG